MKRMRLHKKSKGTTIAEMMAASMMFMILLAIVGGALSPAYAIFRRNLAMQRADIIADNILRELRGCMREAYGLVKIYSIPNESGEFPPNLGANQTNLDGSSSEGVSGSASGKGNVLEFMHKDGYVFVVTADGAPQSAMKYDDGISPIRTADETGLIDKIVDEIPKGIMSVRRYSEKDKIVAAGTGILESYSYNYTETSGIQPIARDMYAPFPDDYYMDMKVSITFSFPDGVNEGNDVKYVEAAVTVSNKDGRPVAAETAYLDLRYVAKRTDKVTAK